MFDIGWSEILVIAVVAIVVVGPKDLPPMLRAAGRMVSKARRTAGDFQAQFNEALREAELDGVQDSINELRGLNPLNDIKKSLDKSIEPIATAMARPESAPKLPPPTPSPAILAEAASPVAPAETAVPAAAVEDVVSAVPTVPVVASALPVPVAASEAGAVVPVKRTRKAKPKAESDAPEANAAASAEGEAVPGAKPVRKRTVKAAVADVDAGATVDMFAAEEAKPKKPRASRAKAKIADAAPAKPAEVAAVPASQLPAGLPNGATLAVPPLPVAAPVVAASETLPAAAPQGPDAAVSPAVPTSEERS